MTSTPPLSPEVLVPLMGDYMVEKGLINREDLDQALRYQKVLRAQGEDRLIGQILIDLGLIDRATRDATITELILQLKAALQEANQQLQDANQQLERRVEQRTAELQKALEKLSELNQLKANIVANISHELRTPLTHLKGYVELLMWGDLGPLTEQQHSSLTIIERSTERLGRLIEDLLLFSTSERGHMPLAMRAFDLAPVCNTAVQKSRHKAKDRNIRLGIVCEDVLPPVEGDEEKISWVIMQLLDNSIKFTQPGGMVTLQAQREQDSVLVSITDTGIGIPVTRFDEIFESFHQLDGSTTRRAGGTGLGLALARNIIEAHGSVIQVSSEIGKGSRFAFSIKIYPGNPAQEPPAA